MNVEQREHQYYSFGETYIKYRKVVGEWMIEVCAYLNLHLTTTHAAIAYLDRLQPNEKFSRFEWQMLAICCILIAAKYNEMEEHVPRLHTIEDITQQTLSKETLLNFELWALKKMGWKLNARTSVVFLGAYAQIGLCNDDDVSPLYSTTMALDAALAKEVFSLASKTLLEPRLKHLRASDIAGAIIFVVRKKFEVQPLWNLELTTLTECDPSSLSSSSSSDLVEILSLLDEVYPIKSIDLPTPPKPIVSNKDNNSTPVGSKSKQQDLFTPDPSEKENGKNTKHMVSPDSIADMILNM